MSAPQFMALCDQRFVSCFCAKWTYSHQVLLGVLFSGAREGKPPTVKRPVLGRWLSPCSVGTMLLGSQAWASERGVSGQQGPRRLLFNLNFHQEDPGSRHEIIFSSCVRNGVLE